MSSTPAPPPASPPPPGVPAPTSTKGFLGRLFDLSFSEFITPSLIKIIFIIGIVISGFAALAVFVTLANEGGGAVVLGIVLAPLIFFVYVLMARVFAEVYLILFKIEENTRR